MKPKKMTDIELVAECQHQSSRAMGSETSADELTESRTKSLDYYLGRARGDEQDGCSDIISMDVADTVHAMLAQIMPAFAQDTVVQFEAENEDDETQARTESDFCNYVVMEKNKGFVMLETAIKDALLSKNAVVKVYVDVKEDIETEKYQGLNDIEIVKVLQPQSQNEEVIPTKFDEKTGDVTIKRVRTKRKLVVSNVAPENFSVSSDLKSPYVEDTTYCRERFWKTKSDLIEEGYDAKIVMELPRATSDTKADSITRNQVQDEQNFSNDHPSMHVVELEEHYIRIDYDGDGIAELRKVLTCGSNLIETEEVPCIPYASGTGFLMGHRFYGLSIYDLLKNIQDGKTLFLRQWIDNAIKGNHKKYKAMEEDTNMDDLLNGRSTGVIRVKHMGALEEMPTNDIGPSCAMGLEYLDKVRTERTGSALDLQTQQMNTPHNVGDAGVNTIVANLEQIGALVTKNLSETLISSIYLLVHKFLKLYFKEELQAKINGNWSQTNPSEWLDREQINISVGLTKTERMVQQVAIEKIIAKQEQYMQMGYEGVIADKDGLFRAILDHSRMSGIDHPEKYWIDPSSDQAQQASQGKAQQMQQQQMEQMQLQNQMIGVQIAEVQRNAKNDQEELKLKYDELKQKYDEMMLKAEIEEAKIIGKATTDLELAQMKFTQESEYAEPNREVDQ